MNGNQNEQTRQENCRLEYGAVTEGWKFFATLRFVVAAFAITLQSVLITLYIQAIKEPADKENLEVTIAGAVMYAIIAISFIERRTVTFLMGNHASWF